MLAMQIEKLTNYERHYESSGVVAAGPEVVFDLIDDHRTFYAHVLKLARLLGGRMTLEMDDGGGKAVGSRIRLFGRFLGRSLSLEEVITRRDAPHDKTWQTVGLPNFLVLGEYRFRMHVEPDGRSARLTIAMDYDSPAGAGWLKRRVSDFYARLCAAEMVKSAQRRLGQSR